MKYTFTIIAFLLVTKLFSQEFEIIDIDIPDDYYGSVELIDFDNDTDLDILFTGSNGSSGNENMETIILINQGMDSFDKFEHEIPGTESGKIRAFDYNNDSLVDIFVMGFNPPNRLSKLYKNIGDTLIEIFDFSPGLSGGNAKWSDLNNDSLPDLVQLGQNSSYQNITRVYKNNGDDTFSEVSVDFENIYGGSIDIEDFNNDSQQDILIVGGFPNSIIKLYENKGEFQFDTVETNISAVQGRGIFWDFNNDKHFDILLGGFSSFPDMITKYYKNIEDTSFMLTGFNFQPLSYPSFSIADFNSDSLPDLILSGEDQTTNEDYLTIYYNLSDTIIKDTINNFNGLSNGEISCGDYDVDGDIDFIITGDGYGRKTVLYKNIGYSGIVNVNHISSSSFSINVYPNPLNDILNISLTSNEITDIVGELIDLRGYVIHGFNKRNIQGNIELSLDLQVESGVYLLKLHLGEEIFMEKLIVK